MSHAIRPNTAARILSVGSIVVDMSMRVPAIPTSGQDVVASTPSTHVGGGYNILAAAARQGARTLYLGLYGNGPRGNLVRQALEADHIDSAHFADQRGDTGLTLALIEPNAERTLITAPGVEAWLNPHHLSHTTIEAGDIVFVSGYDLTYPEAGDTITNWVLSLARHVQVVVDPGPLIASIPTTRWDALVRRTTLLTVNRAEAHELAGRRLDDPTDLHHAIRQASGLAPSATLVIRHGPNGCTYTTHREDHLHTIEGIPVEATDTTGAGDTHTGVLMARLLEGAPIHKALRAANAAAAISVTRAGPATAPHRLHPGGDGR